MTRSAGYAAALGLLAACSGSGGQELRTVEFGIPPDTIVTRYVNVPLAAWLGGDRWAVVAGEFDEAVIADFAAGEARRLGGRGDAELTKPFAVYSAGDTAFVSDWSRRVTLAWTRDGSFAGSRPSVAALRGAYPRARDAAGQLYFEVPPVAGPAGTGNQDSAAVVRISADGTRLDTVARLSPLDLAEVDDTRGRRLERRVFSGTDVWGVSADGSLWVARVFPNRVDVIGADGRVKRGPALPDRIFEVTTTDREHFILQFPEELQASARSLPFAPLKPPFTAAASAPDGSIWLEKSRPVEDSTRRYHVLRPDTELDYIAVLPSRQGRVIALGEQTALVAEQYAEGVRLMQVRIPRPSPAPAP